MKKGWIIFGGAAALVLVVTLAVGWFYYNKLFPANIHFADVSGSYFLYIREGDSLEDLTLQLANHHVIKDEDSFEWTAEQMEYTRRIIPGKYKLVDGESNYSLIKRLRSGSQVSINVTFINVRSLNDLAQVISKKIDVDSSNFIHLLNNKPYLDSLGYTKETLLSLFIPNTYQFYWATNAKGFIQRMKREHKNFWSDERLTKAKEINLSPVEVATLASIVDEESNKNDEKPIIAGLYMNRVNMRMPLQADPTVKFALNDFARKRILTKDLEINSPYNTYKVIGLPPGPIRIASVQGLEAVLNYQRHDYLFMCAKEDLSGYHYFTRSLAQHNANARRYQAAIRQLGIRR